MESWFEHCPEHSLVKYTKGKKQKKEAENDPIHHEFPEPMNQKQQHVNF